MRRTTYAQQLQERTQPEPNTGCLLWLGAVKPTGGHGVIYAEHSEKFAHRAAWELANGPIPSELCICHKCDTPSCVNVDHMFMGTQTDNVRDMEKKGRRARGERVGAAKLTWDDVRKMRARYAAGGVTQSELAREFRVSGARAHEIVNYKSWKEAA